MADNIVNFLYFVRSILYEYQTNIIFLSVSGTQYAPGVAYIYFKREGSTVRKVLYHYVRKYSVL